MNLTCLLVMLLYFSSTICNANIDQQSKLIASVIRTFGRPATVISTVCWPKHRIVELFSYLSEENVIQTSMVHIDEVNEIPRTNTQEHYTVFLVDLTCVNSIEFINMGNVQNYFRSPYRWIIIDKNNLASDIIPQALTNVNILIDGEVLLVRNTNQLYLVYKINLISNWTIEPFNIRDDKNSLQISNQFVDSVALRRMNLKGNEIKICYVLTDDDSINHLTDKVKDYVDTITKVNFPTTNHLLDFLNAQRKYYFANTWGYRVNGTWNGMTGYLVRREVDIGGSPMFFTSERIPFVDYIASPTPTLSKFVFQQPKLSYENNLFLLSFRTSVWYSIIALIFLVFLVLLIVTIWEWKCMEYNKTETDFSIGVLRANIADIVVLMFGAACQQGSPVELKGVLGRVVMLILFLTLMFLYTSYSANIVSLLQSSSTQIKTLEDLLNSRIKLGVHDTVFNKYYFTTATEPIRKAIYEKKIAPPGAVPRFMSMEEGIKKMEKGLFAFHMEIGVGYKFVGKYFKEGEKCGLREIQYLQVMDPYLAVQKDTPYKEMFKIGLKRIQEHGLQNRENRFLYEKRPKCSGRESNFVSVSMVDCYPALLVLSYGTIFALVILAFESLWFYRHNIRNKIRCLLHEHKVRYH
uniref:Antennal ionotropic receptor 75q2-2 n=2 Tax=Dendrolimus punctatus TaxID=238572 RepID=A0A2K8GL75_9NEOP|nr:antennal ionotropic receptor 75q2-2 [Dendrolimus punctatus]